MQALFLDLDDTLLANPMDSFVPAYFESLSRWASGHVAGDLLISELLRATNAVQANDGMGATNEEVFASLFYPALGRPRDELEPLFARYYEEKFDDLRHLTAPQPASREVLEWAFAHDLDVVIATNPVFPRRAIEKRLEWAGIPVTTYDYSLVTTFENMHATKNHPAYYREILDVVACPPSECLMVGDCFRGDVVQAGRVGIPGFWIAGPDEKAPDPTVPIVGRGDLTDLLNWLKQADSLAETQR